MVDFFKLNRNKLIAWLSFSATYFLMFMLSLRTYIVCSSGFNCTNPWFIERIFATLTFPLFISAEIAGDIFRASDFFIYLTAFYTSLFLWFIIISLKFKYKIIKRYP